MHQLKIRIFLIPLIALFNGASVQGQTRPNDSGDLLEYQDGGLHVILLAKGAALIQVTDLNLFKARAVPMPVQTTILPVNPSEVEKLIQIVIALSKLETTTPLFRAYGAKSISTYIKCVHDNNTFNLKIDSRTMSNGKFWDGLINDVEAVANVALVHAIQTNYQAESLLKQGRSKEAFNQFFVANEQFDDWMGHYCARYRVLWDFGVGQFKYSVANKTYEVQRGISTRDRLLDQTGSSEEACALAREIWKRLTSDIMIETGKGETTIVKFADDLAKMSSGPEEKPMRAVVSEEEINLLNHLQLGP
ncbi:MAG TPA: hypothetical protein VHD56_06345 [Tepidisphaeraceae bacterium]|nr:hypothetical protein [Tepidisphaeraceae bacterium]